MISGEGYEVETRDGTKPATIWRPVEFFAIAIDARGIIGVLVLALIDGRLEAQHGRIRKVGAPDPNRWDVVDVPRGEVESG